MSTITKRDAVDAAMSIAADVAEGRLAPATLEVQLVAELRELFGQVVGPGDPLWETQANVARQAIALGALTADELGEWAAVARRREAPEPDETQPEQIPLPTVALSLESVDAELITEPSADAVVVEPAPVPAIRPPVPATEYDPLRGWDPGGTRRL